MTSPLCEGPPSAKGDPLNPSCLVADSSENTQPAAVLQEPVRNPAAVRRSRQALLRDAIQEKATLLEIGLSLNRPRPLGAARTRRGISTFPKRGSSSSP